MNTDQDHQPHYKSCQKLSLSSSLRRYWKSRDVSLSVQFPATVVTETSVLGFVFHLCDWVGFDGAGWPAGWFCLFLEFPILRWSLSVMGGCRCCATVCEPLIACVGALRLWNGSWTKLVPFGTWFEGVGTFDLKFNSPSMSSKFHVLELPAECIEPNVD